MAPVIVFANQDGMMINGNSDEEKPIGGSERALIRMAAEMKRHGWETHVLCNCDKPGTYDGVEYAQVGDLNAQLAGLGREIDVFVSSRCVIPFVGGRPPHCKRTVAWMHDVAIDGFFYGMERAIPHIDNFFLLSEFQAEGYERTCHVPRGKIKITRNGVHEGEWAGVVAPKKRRHCIYCSGPRKGLDILLMLWPRIRARVPDATLDIYSGLNLYGKGEDKLTERNRANRARAAEMYGLRMSEAIGRKEILRAMMEADVLVYPNNMFLETYCMVAIEAERAGTAVVSSAQGALPEVVTRGMGVLVDGPPYGKDYQARFVDEVVRMLTDDGYRAKFNNSPRDMSWSKVAEDWIGFFKEKGVEGL